MFSVPLNGTGCTAERYSSVPLNGTELLYKLFNKLLKTEIFLLIIFLNHSLTFELSFLGVPLNGTVLTLCVPLNGTLLYCLKIAFCLFICSVGRVVLNLINGMIIKFFMELAHLCRLNACFF